MKKRLLTPILVSIAIVILFVLLIFFRSQTDISKTPERAWKVTTLALQPGDCQPQIILHGKTESPNYSVLEAAIDADVIETPVYEGELVNQGDIVLQLDNQEALLLVQQRNADVLQLQAEIEADRKRHVTDQEALALEKNLLELNKRALQREEYLQERNLGTDVAVDTAETNINQQEIAIALREFAIEEFEDRLAQLTAQLEHAKALAAEAALDLSRTTLRAPFNARIAALNVAVGNRAQNGEALIELYAIDTIEIRATIPSNYLPKIKLALSESIPLTGTATIDEQPLVVQLNRLASVVSSRRGGVDGLFVITEPASHLNLARPVTILLNLPTEKNCFEVPNTAVYGDRRVYTINEQQRLVAVPVQSIGYTYQPQLADEETATLIKGADLHHGMLIITNQLPNARTNLFVEPVDE